MIIVIIGIYVLLNFFKIFRSKTILTYEVTDGEIVNVDRHRGFIYRDEYIASSQNEGYVNFYVTNTEKVYRGQLVYSIDDTESVHTVLELTDSDKEKLLDKVKFANNNITNLDFLNIYLAKQNNNSLINEINIVKQLEKIDVEKEIIAKEKGYSKYAGLISFYVDGYESDDILDYKDEYTRDYANKNLISEDKKVSAGSPLYKIIKDTEISIAFDSDYDYDNDTNKTVNVKFIYENVSMVGHVSSFLGNDGKKHFILKVSSYPDKFLDKRIVEFEIENKKIAGFKVPIKSIVKKNCYILPKNMVDLDPETGEYILYKYNANSPKSMLTCNLSKEDDKYYYISIDDSLSKLRFGDVLTNRYGDTYSLSEVKELSGVYNMNKGYAIFKNVDVIDRTNEYAIVKKGIVNSISLYDRIALDATDMNEGDLIS